MSRYSRIEYVIFDVRTLLAHTARVLVGAVGRGCRRRTGGGSPCRARPRRGAGAAAGKVAKNSAECAGENSGEYAGEIRRERKRASMARYRTWVSSGAMKRE